MFSLLHVLQGFRSNICNFVNCNFFQFQKFQCLVLFFGRFIRHIWRMWTSPMGSLTSAPRLNYRGGRMRRTKSQVLWESSRSVKESSRSLNKLCMQARSHKQNSDGNHFLSCSLTILYFCHLCKCNVAICIIETIITLFF